MELYNGTSRDIARIVTRNYSTSFYTASSLLGKKEREAIFSIYGFVRFADEIVDTFHGFNKAELLKKFEKDFYDAKEIGISLNPILNSFQKTVREFNIPDSYIQAFLNSMKKDLHKIDYENNIEINEYIYGSADVVGLMCLKIFCNGDHKLFEELEKPAMKLGSAFQKINFLRDLKNDIEKLDRSYFPEIDKSNFDEAMKAQIISEIEADLSEAHTGIGKLPRSSRLAVAVAFYYYATLLKKIKSTKARKILSDRIRISNLRKLLLIGKAWLRIRTIPLSSKYDN